MEGKGLKKGPPDLRVSRKHSISEWGRPGRSFQPMSNAPRTEGEVEEERSRTLSLLAQISPGDQEYREKSGSQSGSHICLNWLLLLDSESLSKINSVLSSCPGSKVHFYVIH